jgi:DNA-binding NarL/FixJ family response regulator
MYNNTAKRIPPEIFKEAKDQALAIIGWVSTETGHIPSREFSELLAGYLTTAHFAFIEAEAKLHHTLDEITGALSVRQNEIVHYIINGMTNKAIAETIHVSEATVHHEVTKILKTFQVLNRGQLMGYFKKLEDDRVEREDEETG